VRSALLLSAQRKELLASKRRVTDGMQRCAAAGGAADRDVMAVGEQLLKDEQGLALNMGLLVECLAFCVANCVPGVVLRHAVVVLAALAWQTQLLSCCLSWPSSVAVLAVVSKEVMKLLQAPQGERKLEARVSDVAQEVMVRFQDKPLFWHTLLVVSVDRRRCCSRG
jgi:hypothetical protein